MGFSRGVEGFGEGNLAGARITIIDASAQGGGACCLGESCWQIGESTCDALGGEYQGDGTNCRTADCDELVAGPCCEPGGLPGCEDLTCSYIVCLTLPDCCDVLWDAECADLAIEVCNDCDGTTDFNRYALDFGMVGGNCGGPTPVYTGTYDGSSGFLGLEIGDCGSVESRRASGRNGAADRPKVGPGHRQSRFSLIRVALPTRSRR